MADNVAITAGSGTTIATDEVTINAVAVQAQRVKMILGPDGTYTADAAGRVVSGSDGALYVDPRKKLVRLQITPVVSTTAYTSGDCLGPLTTVSNAVRFSGGSGRILGVQVLDKTQAVRPLMDLVLFDRTVTTAADNAPFQCSDADMAFCLGVIPLVWNAANQYNTAWPGTPLNSIATIPGPEVTTTATQNFATMFPFNFVCSGTDLFAQLVIRSASTLTTTADITVSFTIEQD